MDGGITGRCVMRIQFSLLTCISVVCECYSVVSAGYIGDCV